MERNAPGRSGIRFVAALGTAAAAVGLSGPPAAAEDKNGVAPTAISRPTGPGSLEGLGDAFQPALNTGTARHRLRLELAAGIAGFTPELALQYDSGQGYSPIGIGWALDIPSVRRQTDKGLPRYIDLPGPGDLPDRFLGVMGEELIPLRNGYYLPKLEGTFLRYRRTGNTWEAHTRGGIKMEFGSTAEGRVSDPTGTKTYRWCLQRQTDTHGNEIIYTFVRPSETDREVYLSEIRYGPGAAPWAHSYGARLFYTPRPDPRSDYRPGFRVRSAERLVQVDILFDETLIRRYLLRYDTHPHWSLLSSITQLGDDGITALPITTFQYATVPAEKKETVLSAAGHVISSLNEPPIVMDNAQAELLDVNTDSLPDVVVTDAGHLAYLNRGLRTLPGGEQAVAWEGPLPIEAKELRTFDFELSEGNVHLADMTGDAVADLVVTADVSVEYFPNSGHLAWDIGRPMSVGPVPPPAPFGPGGASVRVADFDFDKRMDVIKSDTGAYSVWLNLEGGSFGPQILNAGAFYNGNFVDFADSGVHLADMNGDRLTDVVKVLADRVVWFAGMGFGRFDEPKVMPIPDRALDDSPGGNLTRAMLTDANGDGMADLVVERAEGPNLWFWLTLSEETLAALRIVTDLPATSSAVTRFADLNGNGTTDLIYADSTAPGARLQAVDLGDLIAGTPHRNALIGMSNGYGRRIAIAYRSSTDYYVDAFIGGHPWSVSLPFPVAVVSGVRTSIGLDLDGYPAEGPGGDVYLTEYVYRDGFYDPLEKQFRGFAFVKQIDRGDERFGGSAAPTLVTRYQFHTGAADGEDNDGDGDTDEEHLWDGREEAPLKGLERWREVSALPDDSARDGLFADSSVVFSREQHDWLIRDAATPTAGVLPGLFGPGYQSDDPHGRTVHQPVETEIRRTIIERQADPLLHRQLRKELDLDPLGNVRFIWNHGDISRADDDLYTLHEYALNEGRWIVDRTARIVQQAGAANGPFVSETRNYYDGTAFQGLPLGQIGDRALLHRREAVVTGGVVPALNERSLLRGDPRDPTGVVNLFRQEFDAFGNLVTMLDPDGVLGLNGRPDGSGHEQRIEYDGELRKFPIRETLIVGGEASPLIASAAYHFGFGKISSYTDFNGHTTRYAYDVLGRLQRELLPGDGAAAPTRRYVYELGNPVSRLRTISHDRESGSPDVETSRFFDGLGRTLGTFEQGGPAMIGVTLFNPRGQVAKVFQPYQGQPLDGTGAWLLPDPNSPAVTSMYDATGRAVETLSPPDEDGIRALSTKEYRPHMVVERDGEDTRVGSPHFNTPHSIIFDGLDRVVERRTIETLSTADSGEFVIRYRYALPNLIAEVEDAGGNVRHTRYDGLGRAIMVNDCDRGRTFNTFDAAGNRVHSVDARGQQTAYLYDGVNRKVEEDYLDDGTELSAGRSPDVRLHYDGPSPAHPTMTNVRGRLAWVEDLSGFEFRGYNARDQLEKRIKSVLTIGVGTQDFITSTLFDNLGRPYQFTYPDGGVVRARFDARGLLAAVSGYVESITYGPSARKSASTYSNGVSTEYLHDPRLRLLSLRTESTAAVFQNLAYRYDQADNIVTILDHRALSADDPRNQAGTFAYDNSYRLIRAELPGYGLTEYDYDRLGNMVRQVSPDIVDPEVAFGQMISGGAGGTVGRVGREPADPPGPHALTSVNDGIEPWTLDYDANGNVIRSDTINYQFDFKDRLGAVQSGGQTARYRYDWADRRVVKRVDGVQTSYIDVANEIRDGTAVKYILASGARVAQVTGPLPTPALVSQRLSLGAGWNLISFQVIPKASDPATLLANLDGSYSAVYGFENNQYLEYRPKGTTNTLTSLHPNRGYWIHLLESAELLLEGPQSEDAVAGGVAGAALVGMLKLAHQDTAEWLASRPEIKAIFAYDGDALGWRVIDRVAPSFVSTLQQLAPGRGYWLIVDGAGGVSLTPPAMAGMQTAQTLFYHADHLGSTNVLTDAAGQLVSEIAYSPFGSPRHRSQTAAAVLEPHYLFTDHERDEESGLQCFEKRYYLSSAGRMLSFDKWATEVEVSGPYAYARNNPLRYIDPRGMQPTENDEEKSGAPADEDTIGEIVDDVVDAVPTVVQETNQKAGGIVVSQAGAMTDPDPAKRTEAAEKFAGDVGSAAGEAGGKKVWDAIDANTGWEFKAPLIIGYLGLAYGLALGDTDLPVPIPGIPFGVGEGTVTLSPKIDLAPISTEGEEAQYNYVPGVGLGLSYSTGIFTQSIGGSITPVPGADPTLSGSVGLGVNMGPLTIGTSASGTLDQNYTVGGSLSLKTP